MPRDAWIALAVAAASAFSLWELARTPATGAYVTTTTFPTVLAAGLLALSVVLLGSALLRPGTHPRAMPGLPERGAGARVTALFGITVLYIAALPWAGYLISSALYFGVLSLGFGNRNPVSIVVAMIIVPLSIMLFFEKYMIVLLPSARLFG